jgi:hypothetical protein
MGLMGLMGLVGLMDFFGDYYRGLFHFDFHF